MTYVSDLLKDIREININADKEIKKIQQEIVSTYDQEEIYALFRIMMLDAMMERRGKTQPEVIAGIVIQSKISTLAHFVGSICLLKYTMDSTSDDFVDIIIDDEAINAYEDIPRVVLNSTINSSSTELEEALYEYIIEDMESIGRLPYLTTEGEIDFMDTLLDRFGWDLNGYENWSKVKYMEGIYRPIIDMFYNEIQKSKKELIPIIEEFLKV